MTIENQLENALSEIEKKGLLRSLASPKGVDLASNDYLGLATDQRLADAFVGGVKREGIGSTGSRLLRGERECFASAERRFARWKGTESSLYFATGYQANIGVMQTFLGADDVVFSDELNHASLIDGIRLSKCRKVIFHHIDADEAERRIDETNCRGQKFLVTESLFSMDGDIAPLKKYAQICKSTGTNLIVDEAHSVGLFGERGSGLIEETGIEEQVFLSINTMGKALGVSGAFVAGSDLAIKYLINRCRSFIFSTAPIPAIADALTAAIDIVEDDPENRAKLQGLCVRFNDLLIEHGFDAPRDKTQIVPIIIGDSEKAIKVAMRMQDHGFDARAIRPPTVAEGSARIRVSLNVNLTDEELRNFLELLREEI